MPKIIRKSYNDLGKIYFFTATIYNWNCLLNDANKALIVSYLKELSDKNLIKVYAFVLMPNHIHLIWKQLQKNGKETAQGSFLKYTAHEFLKRIRIEGNTAEYEVNCSNKKHEIWLRDSLSIEIFNRNVASQKLDYIHFNPVNGKWKLSENDLDYYYSSARFYENGVDDFGFLHDLYAEFD